MTWTYRQTNGEIDHEGTFQGTGYSGYKEGRNNPAMESVVGIGPVPKGQYRIGPAYSHPRLGPCVMNLIPVGHDAHGRSAFRIHGNNKTDDASHGCIILGPAIRRSIANSGDDVLLVTT